jgi:hypothetical protein
MALAGDHLPWESGHPDERVTSLLLDLKQRLIVLPWSLFLFAEGTDAEVRATFHTHVVTVEGSGLRALLLAFASQSVAHLTEPDRTAKFASPHPGPQITALSVVENQ